MGLPFNYRFALIIFISLLSSGLTAQTTFWSEDFETDGTGTRYVANNQFIDADGSSEDYFGRIENTGGSLVYRGCVDDPIDVTNAFAGQSGSFFMAGEDMDDTGGCGAPNGASATRTVEFLASNGHGILINGASTMTFKFLVANGAGSTCGVAASRWDAGEGLKVYYSKDGGSETTGICFAPNIECNIPGDNTNEPLHLDLNCDGDGEDGFVNQNFSEYSFTIPSGGTYLSLRVEIIANAGDEEIAFDNLRLEAVTPPEPLPVELSFFHAQKKENTVELHWSTESEINNNYFEIERSQNGADYKTIGRIQGYGTTLESQNYKFIDKNPEEGITYYRLTQYDYDGSSAESAIQSIRFESNEDFIIAPNPIDDFFTISGVNDNSTLHVQIFNINGQLVLSESNKDLIVVSELNPGVYYVRIGGQNNFVVKKIIKQ